jgi:hypothetical protein
MSERHFPSGPWVGFYTHSGMSKKFMMDLVLEFKSGVMRGDGADGIGFFSIMGNYSEQSGECSWIKQYVGRHAVDYRGFREGKGIWGTWKLTLGNGWVSHLAIVGRCSRGISQRIERRNRTGACSNVRVGQLQIIYPTEE